MHKLIEALAALPIEQTETLVQTWIGNELFGIVTYGTYETQQEDLRALEVLRSNPLVEALSDEQKAMIMHSIDCAVRLVTDPDDEDEDEAGSSK